MRIAVGEGVVGARVGEPQVDGGLPAQRRRQLLHVGDPQDRDRGADLLRQGRRPLAEAVQERRGVVAGEEDAAAEQRGHRDQLELQRGDDAEVALAAADGPEQLGLGVGADPAQPAVGGDDLDGGHVVGREAVLATQRAHAPTERVADDPDVGRRPAQPRQPELGGGLHHADPPDAGLDAGDAALGVDVHPLHAAGGDHQRAGGVADGAVTGGLDGDPQVVRDRPGDGGGDVGRAGGAHRDGGGVLDGDVPGVHLGGQPVVTGGVDGAVHLAAEVVDIGRRDRRGQGVEDGVVEGDGTWTRCSSGGFLWALPRPRRGSELDGSQSRRRPLPDTCSRLVPALAR